MVHISISLKDFPFGEQQVIYIFRQLWVSFIIDFKTLEFLYLNTWFRHCSIYTAREIKGDSLVFHKYLFSTLCKVLWSTFLPLRYLEINFSLFFYQLFGLSPRLPRHKSETKCKDKLRFTKDSSWSN